MGGRAGLSTYSVSALCWDPPVTIPPPLPADTPGGLTTWHCQSRCTCLPPINRESPESWPVAPSPIRGPSPTRHALCRGDMPGAPCSGLALHLVFISVHARARITASSPGRNWGRGSRDVPPGNQSTALLGFESRSLWPETCMLHHCALFTSQRKSVCLIGLLVQWWWQRGSEKPASARPSGPSLTARQGCSFEWSWQEGLGVTGQVERPAVWKKQLVHSIEVWLRLSRALAEKAVVALICRPCFSSVFAL